MLARTIGLAAALALAAPLIAQAQSYRCVDKDGKKHYGSTIPPQCVGVAVEQLSAQGTVLRRFEPPAPRASGPESEAEAQRKREREAVARDEARRNRALIATYGSEKDIEVARSRALVENQKSTADLEARIAEVKKRVDDHDRAAKPNAKPSEEIERARTDLKAQEALLAVKKREADVINARYDEDTRRFRELSGLDAGGRGRALGMEKGVTVTTPEPSSQEVRRQQYDAQRAAARDRMELQRIERERENEIRQAEYERRRAEHERRRAEQQTR